MIKRAQKFFRKHRRLVQQYGRPAAIILSFAIVGTIMLVLSKAAVPNASLEPEDGTGRGVQVV